MKEKKRNKYTGTIIILLVSAAVVAGAVTARNQESEEKKRGGFIRDNTTRTETEALGRFNEVTLEDLSLTYTPTQEDTTESEGKKEKETTTKKEEATEYAYAYAGFDPELADMEPEEWNLILVNRDYILPDGYVPALAEAAKGTGVNLDERVAPHYQQMYDAAKRDGITLVPLSGYRRVSTQKRNFENKIQTYLDEGYEKKEATVMASQIILPPGTSEHNAGLAMDICSLDVSFENTEEFKWLQENAVDFGFILRYPKDKTDITKITYEPWHWRYVGVGHAKKINELGICLEEYLELFAM